MGFHNRRYARLLGAAFSSPLSPAGIVARRLVEHERWSDQDVRDYADRAARQLLVHAARRVPYYRRRLAELALDPNRLAWHELPLLSKVELQSDPESLASDHPIHRLAVRKTTSGSTGQLVTVVKDLRAMVYEAAAIVRAYAWAGVRFGQRQVRLWGVPDAVGSGAGRRLKDALLNRERFSAFNVADADFADYVKRLRARRAAYVYGYASMLSRFAEFVHREHAGERLGLAAVISTSEVLTDSVARVVSERLGAPVHNEYGCGEVGLIAFSCERGGLHVMPDLHLLEIVDERGETCAPGEVGEVVVTDLHNFAQPLLRYRLGDRAAWAQGRCACGRSFPMLAGLFGRSYDVIQMSDGRIYHPESILYVMEWGRRQGIEIQRFQAVVRRDGVLLIRFVPECDLDEAARRTLEHKLWELMQARVPVAWEPVDQIQQESSGKTRLVKCEDDAQLTVLPSG